MKKFFCVMFIMTLCVSGTLAQGMVDADSIDASEIVAGSNEEEAPAAGSSNLSQNKMTPKTDNYEDFADLIRKFNDIALANQRRTTDDYRNILVPVEGKSKFMRRHHVMQRMEISLLSGQDKNLDVMDAASDNMDDSNQRQTDDEDKDDGHLGLNVGLSFLFVPGKIEGDQLKLNKFGIGYSIGLLASFDKQSYYGVTCDFLARLGIETGYGHQMGVGFDLLVGTGKSSGTFSYGGQFYDDSSGTEVRKFIDWDEPYTAWCFKYGGQLSLRCNLLKTAISNTDVHLFVRYVYSVDPHRKSDLEELKLDNEWMEESWQFGLAFCYFF